MTPAERALFERLGYRLESPDIHDQRRSRNEDLDLVCPSYGNRMVDARTELLFIQHVGEEAAAGIDAVFRLSGFDAARRMRHEAERRNPNHWAHHIEL